MFTPKSTNVDDFEESSGEATPQTIFEQMIVNFTDAGLDPLLEDEDDDMNEELDGD